MEYTDMPESMFDRLGDMLSDVLESGAIPESKKASPKEDGAFFNEQNTGQTAAEEGNFNDDTSERIEKKAGASEGICEHPKRKLSSSQKKALEFFSLTEDSTTEQARSAYRSKLKYFHPDRHGENPVLQKVARDKTRQTLEMWNEIAPLFEK